MCLAYTVTNLKPAKYVLKIPLIALLRMSRSLVDNANGTLKGRFSMLIKKVVYVAILEFGVPYPQCFLNQLTHLPVKAGITQACSLKPRPRLFPVQATPLPVAVCMRASPLAPINASRAQPLSSRMFASVCTYRPVQCLVPGPAWRMPRETKNSNFWFPIQDPRNVLRA